MSIADDTKQQAQQDRADTVTGAVIGGLRAATVFVTDRERALEFYVGTLGFEKRADAHLEGGPRRIEVAPPGAQTGLVLVQPSLSVMGAERASSARQRIGESTGVVFEADDIGVAYRELRARGVDARAPAADEWGEIAVMFRDPDGNEFLLVEASHR